MKVIFIKDLKGHGKKDEIKEVKDGFGQNFLIKNGYARPANLENVKHLKHEIDKRKADEEELIKNCNIIKEKLEKKELKFKLKAGKNDQAFGSVSTKAIADELKKQSFDIDKKKIFPTSSLASLGTHIVEINLHKQVVASVKIVINKES